VVFPVATALKNEVGKTTKNQIIRYLKVIAFFSYFFILRRLGFTTIANLAKKSFTSAIKPICFPIHQNKNLT